MVCYALIAGSLVRNNNLPVVLAMLLCIVLGIIVGAANGVLIGIMNLPPFLATLCTCMITRGAGSLCSATPWPGLTQEADGSIQSLRLQLEQEEVLPVILSVSYG